MSFPDPNQPDPMRGRGPAEPLEHTLGRIEAAAQLVTATFCHHCFAELEVAAMDGELPLAVGVVHHEDCPDFDS
jgi:hypothetical protein